MDTSTVLTDGQRGCLTRIWEREEAAFRARVPKSLALGSKARKATSRTFRTAAGPRVTVEWSRGLDDDSIRSALAEALAALDSEGRDAEAA